MSRLPQLEAQLVAAAAGAAPPRRRARAPRRIAAGLLAAACAAAALLAFAPRREAPPARAIEPFPTVSAATLARSRALTTEPRPGTDSRDPIPHAELPAVAAEIQARTPYPPGMRDSFDWATPSTSAISARKDVQSLVEYRAYCLWLKYWLSAQAEPAALAGAATVVADSFSWPSLRQTDAYELKVQAAKLAAVESGDVAPIQREVDLNCRST